MKGTTPEILLVVLRITIVRRMPSLNVMLDLKLYRNRHTDNVLYRQQLIYRL